MQVHKEKVVELVGEDWAEKMLPLFRTNGAKKIVKFLSKERSKAEVFPSKENVFRAFRECPYHDVKVVIIGQDPYHTKGMADGLAFSVKEPPGGKLPPSLKNIFKEVEANTGFSQPSHDPDLTRWARQGVFLLNTSLTVREGEAGSHMRMWKPFTSKVLEMLVDRFHPTIFVAWGNFAQRQIRAKLDDFFHAYFHSYHPSPLSAHRGFFNCQHFSKINQVLENHDLQKIDWNSSIPKLEEKGLI